MRVFSTDYKSPTGAYAGWAPCLLGVPLRVGLFAAMACLSGQAISAAIPNAEQQKIGFQTYATACLPAVYLRFYPNTEFLSHRFLNIS
jgi:hypothetical protein